MSSSSSRGLSCLCPVPVLEDHGIHDYLVGLDGEVQVRGHKNGREGRWNVAVEAPVADARQAWDILQPRDCAIATSGDYRKFFSLDGKRYAHTIDPRTARPVVNSIGSVTVSSRTCMMADAWATALLVLGPDAGVELARQQDIAALFLIRSGSRIDDIATGRFSDLIG